MHEFHIRSVRNVDSTNYRIAVPLRKKAIHDLSAIRIRRSLVHRAFLITEPGAGKIPGIGFLEKKLF